MLPSFQGSSGPYSPGSFPNRVGPDSPGIWSRFLLPSVPGTEEAERRQSLHPVTEGGRQEHPCPRRQRLMGGSSAVSVRSLVHHQEQRTHQHSPWVPSSGWEPKGHSARKAEDWGQHRCYWGVNSSPPGPQSSSPALSSVEPCLTSQSPDLSFSCRLNLPWDLCGQSQAELC